MSNELYDFFGDEISDLKNKTKVIYLTMPLFNFI